MKRIAFPPFVTATFAGIIAFAFGQADKEPPPISSLFTPRERAVWMNVAESSKAIR
jgi:hypothetical protein